MSAIGTCGTMNFNDSDLYFVPATYPQTFIAIKVTAGITCILSILGASLIILTYVAFKELRTIARQLLVNLSVADIILCLSHFVGLWVNNTRFLPHYNPDSWNTSTTDPLCITQGAFTVYSTIAGFLWSMLIAVYLLVLIISKRPSVAKVLVPIFYCIGWGLPVIAIIFSAVKRYFGYEPIAAGGWCYTTADSAIAGSNSTIHEADGDVFSYEIWFYLSFGVLTIMYIILFIILRYRKVKSHSESASNLYALRGDLKLLCVPFIFFFLRIWNTIVDIGLHHGSLEQEERFQSSIATAVILVFAGIGQNAQGFANAILFCVFTREVRKKLQESLFHIRHCRLLGHRKQYRYSRSNSNLESVQNTFGSLSIQLANRTSFANHHYGTHNNES